MESSSLLPCLACGKDLSPEVDSIIKQEIDCDDVDDELIAQSFQTGFSNDRTFIINYNRDQEESGSGKGIGGDVIFQWFLKWFKIDFEVIKKSRKKGKGRRELGQDGQSRDDTLPFCGTCRSQLAGLLELQLKLDELGRQIENGIGEFKEKIQSSEVDFENKGIYKRDPRYKSLRSKIIKSTGERERLSSKISKPVQDRQAEVPNSDGGRKSSRTKRPISRFTSSQAYDVAPVVVVSPIDKAAAEEHLLKIENEPATSSDTEEICTPVPRKRMKKHQISAKNKNIKSRQANTNTTKKRKLPHQPKNVKKNAKRESKNGTKSPPTPKIKEECDEDWVPNSPPAQDWDDDLNNDSNAEYSEDNLKSHSSPPRKKQKIKKNQTKDIPEKPVNSSNDPPKRGDDDNNSQEDNSSDRIYRRFTEDPQNKTLSYGEFVFKQLGPQGDDGEESQLHCITCSLVIPEKKSWVRAHVTKVHTNRFTCPQCPARFSTITNMRLHIQGVHQGNRVQQKKPPCDICGARVTGPIKKHKWTHKNKEEKEEALATNSPDVPDHYHDKLQCDECGQSFSAKCYLQNHIERHHSGQTRKLELCPECGGSYKELQAHLRYAHSKTEPQQMWECTEVGCGKKFKFWSHLTQHKKIAHLKIKPFKCNLCPRTFGSELNLKRHVNSHLGIRPFKCDSCPSAFITRSAVNNHRRIFHEEGSAPRRKSYVRGPTMLEVGVTQEELRKKKMYYPPSLIRGAGSRMTGSSSQDNVGRYCSEEDRNIRQDDNDYL